MGRPSEPLKAIPPTGNAGLATGRVFLYGLDTFRDLMTPRQLATTAALAASVRNIHETALSDGLAEDRAKALSTCLGLILDRVILRSNNNCLWDTGNLSVTNAFGRQVIVMVWDFAETNPFGAGAGQVIEYVHNVADIVESLARVGLPVDLHRGSATSLPYPTEHFDAVITDPPYYDNISYANLSDFFYV